MRPNYFSQISIIIFFLLVGLKVTYSQVKLDSGLVGFFKLDSNYADSSISALNATANSVTDAQGIHGLNNTGSLFNGSSSYLNANTSNRGVTNTISISVWVKTSVNSINNQCLVSKYDWNVNKGYHLNFKYGYPNIEGRNSSNTYIKTTNTTTFISDGNWHHVLGVVAGNNWEIWVDGVLASATVSTTTSPDLTNNYPTSIGCYHSNGTNNQFFNGTLDETRIYSRELRPTEIAYLSNQRNNITSSNVTACDSYTTPSGSHTWTSSGTYTEIKYGSTVADSIALIAVQIANTDTAITQIASTLHAAAHNNYLYQWLDCTNGNAPIAGAQDSVFIPSNSGVYAVAINNGGCLDTSNCVTVNVVNNSLPYENSIFLDGVSNFIEIPNHANLHSSTNLTLEAWIKPCGVTGQNVVFSKIWCSGQQNSYFLSVEDGKLKWVWYTGNCGAFNGVNRYKSTNVVIQSDVWQHIAIVHAVNSVKLFVNGIEVLATLEVGSYGNLRPSSQPLRVGTYRSNSGSYGLYFSGQMDELRVWNQSVSSALIASRFNGPLLGSETGLMGYYNLDNYTVGPNQTVPNNATTIGNAGNATTRGSSSYITPFYLDSITSYILGKDTIMYPPATLSFDVSTPSASYLWQDGSTNASYSTSSSGQFHVSLSNSCISVTDTINISLPSPNLDSGLVAHFKFDGNAGDSSSTNLHGTGSNVINDYGMICDSNTAYDFNGTSSKIVCGTNNRGITNTVNISAWVKTTTNTGHRFIVDKYNWSVNKGYLLAVKNGIPYVGARNASGTGAGIGYHTWDSSQTFLVSDGNWHHLLGVVSTNKLEIWVDGVLKSSNMMTAAIPDLTTTYDLNIGYYYKGSLVGNPNYFHGTLDEVRLYNRDLTLTEIDSLQTFRNTYESIVYTACDSMISSSGNFVWNASGSYSDTIPNTCGGDSIYTIDLTILNSSFTPLSELSCGSYTSPSGSYTWSSTGVYYDTLSNNLGCDSILEINLTVSPVPITNLVGSNCYSYTSPSGNITWYSSGVYSDTLQTNTGCDSILRISVTILPYEIVAISETVCDSYTSPSGNNTWTVSGTYLDLISYANDCDTLYNISLTVTQSTTASFSGAVCHSFASPSGRYIWTSSGTYLDTIPNNAGCDSVITFNLTIGSSYQIVENVVSCNSYTWALNNQTYLTSGTFLYLAQTAMGCDSSITLNLTINTSVVSTQIEYACDSFSWSATGLVYTSSTKDSLMYSGVNGCDSLAILDLTIHNTGSSTLNLVACDSMISPSGMITWSNSGTYIDTVLNSIGCDSVITVNLIIHNSNQIVYVVSSCVNYVWSSTGDTYGITGVYRDTLSNVYGCDSIHVLDLTINSNDTSVLYQTSCESYQWPVTSTLYTQSGIYSSMFSNQYGCDSLVQLDLTINAGDIVTFNLTACDSVVSPSTYYTWFTSGLYQDTLINMHGCDSILNINLTINQSIQSVVTVSACDSFLWLANGQTYISSGTYTYLGQSNSGCDSTISLNLTINSGNRSESIVSNCSSYFWPVNAVTYYSSITDSIIYTNVFGCDSIEVLELTIVTLDTTDLIIQSCSSYLWNVNGMNYSASGTYTEVLTNLNGCDSIVVLDLEIKQPTDTLLIISNCGDYTWMQTGLTYTVSGMYSDTLVNGNGCDSVLVLDLAILNASTSTLIENSCGNYTAPDGTLYTVSGQYQVTIANQVGCDSNIIINLNVTHTDTSIVNIGGGLQATSNLSYSYQWLDCNNGSAPISGEQDSIFVPSMNGQYAVEITNGSCLETSACIAITNVGLSELVMMSVSIYPNPVETLLTIKNNGNTMLFITITDIAGKLITRIETLDEITQVDVSRFKPGVYLVKLGSDEMYRIEKIVVR